MDGKVREALGRVAQCVDQHSEWADIPWDAWLTIRAHIEGLEADARRLDWLVQNCAVVHTDGERWRVFYDWLPDGSQYGPWAADYRAAIDSAMQEGA